MNNFFMFIILSLFIISIQTEHLSENRTKQTQVSQNKLLLQSFQRNLQQLARQFEYTLQIPGIKNAGLFIYSLGLRIVGMQNLMIWQIVQLYQQARPQVEQGYFQVGDFIHGYTSPAIFALEGFGYGLMFQKLNLVWEVSVILFIIAIILKHIVAPWYKNKVLKMKEQENKKVQIQHSPMIFEVKFTEKTEMNLMEPKPTTKNIGFSNMDIKDFIKDTESTIRSQHKINEGNFSLLSRKNVKENREDSRLKQMRESILETVDGSNLSHFNCKIKQTESFLQQDRIWMKKVEQNHADHIIKFQESMRSQQKESKKGNSQKKKTIGHEYKKYKKIIFYSNIILKQGVFYIIINSLTIIGYSTIREVQNSSTSESSLSNISFSGYMILISSIVMFMYTFKLVLEKGKGSGETRNKLRNFTYANKIFWGITILERIVYSLLIGSGWKYAIGLICGLKLTVMIVAKFANVWAKSAEYYRNLATNFIQILVIIVLTLDQYYFSSTKKVNLSKTSIAFILMSLLSVCFVLNFAFFLKDLGILGWISNHLRIGSNEVINTSLVIDSNGVNERTQKGKREIGKHVKFVEIESNQLMRDSISSVAKHEGQIKKTIKNIGTLKNMGTSKSIATLYQSEIRPTVKSEIASFDKKMSSQVMATKSISALHKQKITTNTPYEQSRPQVTAKIPKLQIRIHKQISKVIDDALRAEKTKHVIFEQAKQNDYDDSEYADVESIKMDHKR